MKRHLDAFFPGRKLSQKGLSFLNDKGHETLDVRGTPQSGIPDDLIFSIAQEKKAVFLTTDRDFFHTVPFLFEDHQGIIVGPRAKPKS
jgi:predicted nuclease of predicted toxin-antitoxin system